MAQFDWRAFGAKAQKQLGRLPKWTWIAAGSVVIAAVLFAILASGGPPYTPLYEGLSPKQGGEVIENLQKLGIPYQLSDTGSVISVPKPDLARARLELGQAGVPTDSGSEAWQELTKGSLTEGSAAISALSQRVLESSLEKGIDGISGVASSQVSLALPKSTPFLGDQPQPKASVWLHTAGSGVSPTQARAIAQMVANSVPGLNVTNVSVTDQDGNVLAPLAHTGYDQEQQQLAFREQVERTTKARIEGLLAPVVGADNVRVSVSAAVDFDQIDARKVQYGPSRVANHEKRSSEHRIGGDNAAIGVPGALANEPPPDAAIAGPGSGAANAAAAGRAVGSPTFPSSASSNSDITYDVDEATTVSKGAPWHVRAISVSVVLNRGVTGAGLAAEVKGIVANAISAPDLKVNVAAVPFNLQLVQHGKHAAIIAALSNGNLIRAALALLAALLLFFAVARPLARALKKGALLHPRADAAAAPAVTADESAAPSSRSHPDVTEKVRRSVRVASDRPAEAAETLKRWLGDRPNATATGGEEPQA